MIQAKTSLMALIFGLASGILSLVAQRLIGVEQGLVQEVFLFVFISVSMGLFSTALLRWYTRKKIAPIYKTIYSRKLSDPELKQKFHNQRILAKVNEDVQQWVEAKTSEIEHLKELELYRKEFLGNVAHELNTPLFNIQGYVLTLLDGALEDTSINRTYLERTQKNIHRLINTVKDLDAITKLESRESSSIRKF
jgi:two-component system phosphate regulon sensor histidine kinase PhoR